VGLYFTYCRVVGSTLKVCNDCFLGCGRLEMILLPGFGFVKVQVRYHVPHCDLRSVGKRKKGKPKHACRCTGSPVYYSQEPEEAPRVLHCGLELNNESIHNSAEGCNARRARRARRSETCRGEKIFTKHHESHGICWSCIDC
jgi:predicted DsbA family dithiol-disulfide isomerase